ncbi:MAG: diguanylate cyclase [Butyrivibrio sp.]|nr:diguanylate cyclase [Butyrivibrio sp.]
MSLNKLFEHFDEIELSADLSAFIIKTCLHMRMGEDFRSSMDNVAKDLREYTDSYASCIMTISRDLYKFNVVGESVRNNEIVLQNVFDNIPYEVIESWEELTLENDSIIITNSADMDNYEKRSPAWVKTLKENGVETLCLIPFIHQNTIIGYMYVTNFNTAKIAEFKKIIELLSAFVTSEVAHHLLIERLRNLSLIDSRTGVYNRTAMNNMVDELSAQLKLTPAPFSVAFCYLNTLKTVNEKQGHDVGNNLLKEAGKMLKEVFHNDYIYRSSGDEFAVISTTSSEEEFEEKIENLKDLASDPDWLYFTVGYYTDNTDGALHSAMRYANKYEQEFNEEFYYNYPDMIK